MYSLLVSAAEQAWEGEPYIFNTSRVFEYTDDDVKNRFGPVESSSFKQLTQFPAILAYEGFVDKSAMVARLDEIKVLGNSARVQYTKLGQLPEIDHEFLSSLEWELEIGPWEMSRTHWSVKNVDLFSVLSSASQLFERGLQQSQLLGGLPQSPAASFETNIRPSVFRIPSTGEERDLVSVMMPFDEEFMPVFDTLRELAEGLGGRCQNAKHVFDESEIIQNIFSLIYRSKVVICDFTKQNSNVFYEAGIAHTLGKGVIPLAQSVEDLPFDLRHHRAIIYENSVEGRAAMSEEIRGRLQALLNR